MEFVKYEEVIGLLNKFGVVESPEDEDRQYLRLKDVEAAVHMHLACSESTAAPLDGAEVHEMDKDRLPQVIEHMLHKLHLREVLLIPIGKWRKVFDAVAFSLASNEDWQEIDTTASVELNTRDPLLCGPGDLHTLDALIRALYSDAESPDQGMFIATTAAPVLVEIIPDGAARISVGTRVLADEVLETVAE